MTERAGKPGWWLLAALYAAGIWYFSSQPGSSVGIPPPWDKVAHFLEFGGLAFLVARASGNVRTAFVVAALWGALDEVHQSFVPGREAGVPDWIADLVGGLAGGVLGVATLRGGSGQGGAGSNFGSSSAQNSGDRNA